MENDQTKDLEAVTWFDPLLSLKDPDRLIEQLALNPKNKAQKQAASCLLANAYLFSLNPEKHFMVISRRPETYTKNRYRIVAVGFRPFVQRVLPRFEKLKLIKLAKIGMSDRDELGIGFSRRSRYVPTIKLLRVLASHEITIQDVDKGNPETIILRAEKPKRDYRYKQEKRLTGEEIIYTDTDKTRELRAWLDEYNSFVQSFDIDFPTHLEPKYRSATGFHRVFNVDFEHGGRLVGHWIFNIKKEQRHLLRLNGEQVTELDFKSMYPNLLYSVAGLNYHQFHNDGDPYQVADFGRDLVKFGFLVAMTNNTRRGFGKALKNRLRDEGWTEERLNFNSTPLLNAILRKHSPVEHLLFDKKTANHCTYLEATLLQTVLNYYLQWKAPVLPMHDGIITTMSERDRLKKVMEFESDRFLVSVPGVEIEY